MISVQTRYGVCEAQEAVTYQLTLFVRQGRRLGLLPVGNKEFGDDYDWENNLLEGLRDGLIDGGGQCLSLDLSDFEEENFAESLLAELESARTTYPQRINLPLARSSSPFIHRAIAWQRLCDRLIEDEDPQRPTLLIIENFDQANESARCDVERLIRFHIAHNIRRTFLLTVAEDTNLQRPSLLRLVDFRIER